MSTPHQAASEWLLSLHKLGIKFGLSNMRAMCARSGHPERAFPCVHIAGTNGKGSTAAFLAAITGAAGLKVGLTTSPHLARLNERIVVAGRPISGRELAREVAELQAMLTALNAARPEAPIRPTFFEATILLAFRHFARKRVDLAIIETGLGGRLDATNVVQPVLALITNIALEHTELLGTTLPAIAREKGGIIKRGIPLLTTVGDPACLAVLAGLAAKRLAPCACLERDFSFAPAGQADTLDFSAADGPLRGVRLALFGEHQRANAALAFAAARELARQGFAMNDAAIRYGLENARWPGRLEIRPGTPPWLIDCAHNPAGIETLARFLEATAPGKRILFVFAVMRDKDYTPMLARLAGLGGDWLFTAPPVERAEEPKRLAALLPAEAARRVYAIGDHRRALARAKQLESDYDLVVLAGSIYWVGAAQGFLARHRPLEVKG